MTDDQQSLRSLFVSAKDLQKQLEILQSTSDVYQESLRNAVSKFEECRKLADAVHMFSPNEVEEDISSGDLQYLSIDYYLGELFPKAINDDRLVVLRSSQEAYERFLQQLDLYAILSSADKKLLEHYLDDRDEFALLPSSDASVRREAKISRFKQEKSLKHKLEVDAQSLRAFSLLMQSSFCPIVPPCCKTTTMLCATFAKPNSPSTFIRLSTASISSLRKSRS